MKDVSAKTQFCDLNIDFGYDILNFLAPSDEKVKDVSAKIEKVTPELHFS